MAKVKLGDVAREYKSTVKDAVGLPNVGLEHLIPGEIELTQWSEDSENTFTKGFKKGQVLFGRRRAYLKKAAVAPFNGICSGDITVIEAIPEKILPELLPFVIQNDCLFDYAVEKSAGSLSPRVKWEHLKNYEFELPEIGQQKELVELLWAMTRTKKAYQNLLRQTDEFVKSQFIEMFGAEEYPICKLADECVVITKGTTPTTIGYNFTNEGVNFVKIENITGDGHIIKDGMMYISEDCHEAMKRSQLKEGDILFSIAGAIGRSAVVSGEVLPANINQALAIVRLKDDAPFTRGFLMATLQSGYVEKQYMALKRGVAQLNLSLKDVGAFNIPIPPKEKQDEYVQMAERSEESKNELTQAIARINDMIRALMQG